MIEEDDGGGMSGMAVDGMGGMGFTDTGNIAGIALGMKPVGKKKKKKKHQDEDVMESVIALIEKDLESMAKPPRKSLITGENILISRVHPGLTYNLDQEEYQDAEGHPVVAAKPKDLPSIVPSGQGATSINIKEDATYIDHVPSPFYTPLFNDARNIGTPDQVGSLGLPRATRGVRRRAVLAAILGGL